MDADPEYILIGESAGESPDVEAHVGRHFPLARARRVTSRADFEAASAEPGGEVVLFAGNVPGLDLPGALEVLQARELDLPLIVIGERSGEEAVAAWFRRGIADFVLNDNLAGLAPAMERSRREVAARRARRVADAGLAQSEEKYRNLFECSRDATLTSDPVTGKFTSANPAALKMFGVKTEAEFYTLSAVSLSPPRQPDGRPSAETARAMMAIAARDGSHFFEWTHQRCDGRQFFSDVRLTRIELGGKLMLLGTIRDISEQKRAEELLHTSGRQFRAAFETMAIGMAQADPRTGQFLRANRKLCEITGYAEDELRRLRIADLTHPEDRARDWAAFQRVIRGELPAYQIEKRYVRKHGAIAWVNVNVTVVRDDAGEPVRTLATVEDITERRTKTEELRWKSAFLEALIHSSEDGIVVVDNQGRKIFQNQKAVELWKIPPEIAANPDDRVQHEHVLGQVGNPEEFTLRWEHILAHPGEPAQDDVALKDGTVLHRYTSLVRDPEGKSYGRVWVFRDITKRRELETQFRQAQKMEAVGTLAGGIAHDFNNILCSIFGYGYLLQQEPAATPEAREHLAEMLKAAGRAKDLVQQILTFSRQREQKREMIRLGPVIKEAAKFLRASLPANLRIEVDVDDDAPAVLADPTQIHQIAMNLATNALHAMEGRPGRLLMMLTPFIPDDSFIRLHPELRPGRYTRLTVADTGRGMDAKTLERIFEPFFTTKPIGQGTGLGLSVVHGIVQSHDGVITVASTPERGTTFDLYLPAQTADATPIKLTATDIPRGQGGNILFLDDEPALTKPLQRLLEGLNYHVSLSNNPGDALRCFAAESEKYNLVITDLMMPEMNGFEVARQIHDIRPDIPVMLISGHAPDMSHEKLREAGISGMLEKPFSLSDLAEMVKSLV